MISLPFFAPYGPTILMGAGGAFAAGFFAAWMTFIRKFFRNSFHRKQLDSLDSLTPLENQTRMDVWDSIKKYVARFLERSQGHFSTASVKREYAAVRQIRDEGSREIREALGELYTLREDNTKTGSWAGL